jgi:hypothetical protein
MALSARKFVVEHKILLLVAARPHANGIYLHLNVALMVSQAHLPQGAY